MPSSDERGEWRELVAEKLPPVVRSTGRRISGKLQEQQKRRFIDTYDDDVRYLNVGGGDFVRENWRVLDYHTEWYDYSPIFVDFDVDLEEIEPWPIEDNSYSLVFSSHTLEHLSDAAVEWTLQEAKRILIPGGILRLNVPDIDIAEHFYLTSNMEWFVERIGNPNPTELNTDKYVLEEYLLAFFASHLSSYNRPPDLDIDLEDVRTDFKTSERQRFYQKYSNKIEDEWQRSNPGLHRNWFNSARLQRLLRDAGFQAVAKRRCEVSDEVEFTYPEFNKRPFMSINVEATA